MSATHLAWGRPFLSLLEPSFDCIVFDNRGMGRSAPTAEGRSRSPTWPPTPLGLLDALEIERAHVLGISMGGMIAQELALAHPERLRTLTLGATYCGGPRGHADGARGPADARRGDGLRRPRAGLPGDVGDQPLPRLPRRRLALRRLPRDGEGAARSRETVVIQQMRACAEHDTSARLGQISTPTLVIHGTEDRLLGVANGRQIASLIPGARLELLDGRRPHVLVGAARALGRADPRARAGARLTASASRLSPFRARSRPGRACR